MKKAVFSVLVFVMLLVGDGSGISKTRGRVAPTVAPIVRSI